MTVVKAIGVCPTGQAVGPTNVLFPVMATILLLRLGTLLLAPGTAALIIEESEQGHWGGVTIDGQLSNLVSPLVKSMKHSPYTTLNTIVTQAASKFAPKPPDCNTAYTRASNRQNLADVVGAAKASLTQSSTVKPTACLFRSTPCVSREKTVWNISLSVVLANTLYGSVVLLVLP